jgi:uncharacterized metal-binding protein YceD (DUF177 family)
MEEYDVPIYGMKEGVYEYGFTAGMEFFEYFGNPDLTTGSLEILLKVVRRSQFLEFHFEVRGTLRVVCDRCLEEFDYPVESSELLYLRFGEGYEEVDDNVLVIPKEESKFNIAQHVYEYAMLSLPLQKTHPDGRCNPEMLKKLEDHRRLKPEETDPRWDILKKLN